MDVSIRLEVQRNYINHFLTSKTQLLMILRANATSVCPEYFTQLLFYEKYREIMSETYVKAKGLHMERALQNYEPLWV